MYDMYVYIHICIYIYMYIYICIHIYICIYIYMIHDTHFITISGVLDEIHGDFAKNLSGRYLSCKQVPGVHAEGRYVDHHHTS